ncbi:MAG: response regulator transcription factor [Chloroflexi bacterium]|nr:response regulator transcription factor [Chloroflexota bacterium]
MTAPTGVIRIVIVDDMTIMRQGLRLLLEAEEDLQVVGEAEDAERALQLVQGLSPHVVVMEVKGRALDGLSLCRSLRQHNPQVGVAILTSQDGPGYFFEALRCGCHAYIPKSAQHAEVVSGIRSAARLQGYIHPLVGGWLMQDFASRSARPRSGQTKELSPRDLQVLEMVSQGLTNPQMAQFLRVSVNTVRRHRARLMRKVGVRQVGGLIRFALNQGLLKV